MKVIIQSRLRKNAEQIATDRRRIFTELQQGLVMLGPEYEFQVIEEPEQWIKVDVATPEIYRDIIFCDCQGIEYLGTRDPLGRYLSKTDGAIDCVTAWMPAPVPYMARGESYGIDKEIEKSVFA